MNQIQQMEIDEVRCVAARFVQEELDAHNQVQDARNTIQAMCQRASEYGLTAADVIRAVLRPALEEKRGCDCSTCKARRGGDFQESSLLLSGEPS